MYHSNEYNTTSRLDYAHYARSTLLLEKYLNIFDLLSLHTVTEVGRINTDTGYSLKIFFINILL